jgi:integrase/recombinase XerD
MIQKAYTAEKAQSTDDLNKEAKIRKILRSRISMEEILDFKSKNWSVGNWLLGVSNNSNEPIDVKGSTVRHYMRYLMLLCMLACRSPDEIIIERFDQEKTADPSKQCKYENLVLELAEGYKLLGRLRAARELVVALKSFFAKNRSSLLNVKSPRKCLMGQKFHLTKKEIQKILKYCSCRERVIFLILLQSGMRPETLLKLTYRDIKVDFESGILPLKVYISVLVVKGFYSSYMALLGKDAVDALKEYLDYRRAKGEMITDASPLIAKIDKPEPITYGELCKICRRISSLLPGLGINKKMTPYVFRRTFKTMMDGMMSPDWVHILMGHVIPYSVPTNEELVAAYRDAEPKISVSEEGLDRKTVQLDMMKNMARMLSIDFADLMRKTGITELHEMSDEQIKCAYDAFNKVLKQVQDQQDKSGNLGKRGTGNKMGTGDLPSYPNEFEVMIVSNEEELRRLLEMGFLHDKELSDGKHIMKRRIANRDEL